MKRGLIVLAVMLSVSCVRAEDAPRLKAPQRWYHIMTNLLRDEVLDKEIALMKRAAAAGYNGVVVNDVKLIKYHLQPEKYAENVRAFRRACADSNVKFIPCVTPMGYANEILAHDPNLAEGMPVRGATFVVTDGRLVPDASDFPALVNPSFEEFTGERPRGWEIDDPGTISFIDADVKSDGKVSVRQQDVATQKDGRGRVFQRLRVKPFHYYHVSVMVKTEDCKNRDMRIMALSKDGATALNWQPPAIQQTMDWTRIHATFNSLTDSEITLYLGSWNPKTGKIWWDDVQVEPGGWVNIIRRDSLPLVVTSTDGATTYVEGRDFSAVRDPRLANDPNPGYFTMWHEPPTVTVPAGSRLKEGQKILVGYHHATNCGKDFQVTCCMSEPRLYEVMERQIRWMKATADPDVYFMAHDEIRQQGWDDTCAKRGLTCGEILADNAKRCTAIIEKTDPGKPIVVWSDMFDAHHNARRTAEDGGRFIMYLVKGEGPWHESWLGLAPRVGVVNWNGGQKDSYRFFSSRGNQQIISGVDAKKIVQWLKESGKNPGVVGVMYTTWTGDFSRNLENYVEAVRKWEEESGGFGGE